MQNERRYFQTITGNVGLHINSNSNVLRVMNYVTPKKYNCQKHHVPKIKTLIYTSQPLLMGRLIIRPITSHFMYEVSQELTMKTGHYPVAAKDKDTLSITKMSRSFDTEPPDLKKLKQM
jgi:hypothetical protein